MNYRRVLLAGLAAWVAAMALGYLINEVLLAGIFAENAAAMRPEADVDARLPIGFVVMLFGYLAFAYVYAKGYEGGNGVAEGIRLGALVAVLMTAFGLVWQYVMYPISGKLTVVMVVDMFIESMIYGGIIGAVYKPTPKRP